MTNLKLSGMDMQCIKQAVFIHIRLDNITQELVLAHCRRFVSFYFIQHNDTVEICNDLQCEIAHKAEQLQFSDYVKQFATTKLSKVVFAGQSVFISITHALADGATLRQFINTVRQVNLLQTHSAFPGFKTPIELLDMDFEFKLPVENRLKYGKSGGKMRSYSLQLSLPSQSKLNERMNLAASLAIQSVNGQQSPTIGVGNCVDLRRFGDFGQLNYFSGYNVFCTANEEEAVNDVLEKLRFKDFTQKNCLMFWKALQLQRWDYFQSDSACRFELSNAGQLSEGSLMLSGDEAFGTVSMSFYTVGGQLHANLQTGDQLDDTQAQKFIQHVKAALIATWDDTATIGDVRGQLAKIQ